jgi:hypothetical protein
MSDEGAFAVHRGIFSHPVLVGEPYTRMQAWVWLLGNAAWKATRARVGRAVIALERGQLAYSERFLATKWKWSKSKVHRFLSRLQTEAMVTLQTDHETNLITICNYDSYQFKRTSDEPLIGPLTGPVADQQWTKEEEGNKRKNGIAPSAPLLGQPAADAELYARGKQILGKSSGGLIAKLIKSKNGNLALARAAIEQASTKQNPSEYIARIVHGTTGSKVDLGDPQDVMRFILS